MLMPLASIQGKCGLPSWGGIETWRLAKFNTDGCGAVCTGLILRDWPKRSE
jgi:hypothetical protein